MTDNPVKAALSLLKEHRGWYLFPIRRDAKHPPLFDRNLELASNDPAAIRRWAKLYPDCNWGLSLKKSGVIVVDVDGDRGRNTVERRELEHGSLPHTFVVRTPSGGIHYYFYSHAGVAHRMRVGAFGSGVDSTNYVLLPGSAVHGIPYKIIDHAPVIALAPAWFAEYLGTPTIGDNDSSQAPAVEQDTPGLIASATHYLKHDAKPAVQGRNGEYTLLMVAAWLKDHGISQHMAVELLSEHYNERCSPAWDIYDGPIVDRLDAKVANAWNYLNQVTPGARTAQAEFGNDVPDIYETEADKHIGQRNHVESVFKSVYGRNLKRRRS